MRCSAQPKLSCHGKPFGIIGPITATKIPIYGLTAHTLRNRRQQVVLTSTANDAHTEFDSTIDIDATEPANPVKPAASAAATATAAPASSAGATAATPETTTDTTKQEVKSHPIKDDMFDAQELLEELKDEKQFGHRGEAWFIAQVAVLLLVLIPPLPLNGLISLVGTLAITAGVGFMAYGLVSLGKVVSPLPQPRRKHRLVTSGMYHYVRHPMYGGLLMACLGLAAVTRNECRIALSFLLWWVLEQKVAFEERALGEMYPEYEQYKKTVCKFFPYIY